ncbi:MAG TPA: tetratricopeptide repeat protein [Oligoflexus sp.]|uniref:tetratricopeptide repeat protein n=1 Tax=Oligoflexus sp. TaxID=1971216 RepID=UPI002D671AAC|nr:tetratricopeptide repeat protein [Oligoflexus sp.]HYX36975.1 tetratricopeptide repeat protein [Oligoflexus sp.]
MVDLMSRKVLSLCSQQNRELVRKALAMANYKVSFISSLSEVTSAIAEFKPSVLVHDWQAVDETQTRKFHLNFSRTSTAAELIRVLIVPDVTPNLLAFANDALIERVYSYGAASLNLGNELDMATVSQEKSEVSRMVRETRAEGFKYDQKKIDDKVEELYQKYPHDNKVKLEFGNLSFRQNKFAEALVLATDLVAREPQNLRAMNLMARAMMKQGHWDKALQTLETAQILSPSNPERLVLIGDACYGKGDLNKALQCYEEAADLDPDMIPAAHRQMGQIKLEMGEVEEALNLFKNSVSEDESAGFFNNAAVAAVRDGKPEQALKLYETAMRALKTNRLKPLIHFNIALSHRRLGDTESAVKHLKKAMQIDPNYEKARVQLDQITRHEQMKKSS